MPAPITLPVPMPTPFPIPWPSPRPGVGTPAPTTPSIGITPPVPMPTAPSPNLTGNGLSDLFKFRLDWRFLGALLFILLTVELANQIYPEYVWAYVGILLLGLAEVNTGFLSGLTRLVGG